jgi:ankyrin repeat protein
VTIFEADDCSWTYFPANATPLYYALSYGLLEVVNRLLARGVDINGIRGMFGSTPLHAAVWQEHPRS